MIFQLSKSSAPFTKIKKEVKLKSLRALAKFMDQNGGRIVIERNHRGKLKLEIYDDYRE